jgi:CHAD domain-containing protein
MPVDLSQCKRVFQKLRRQLTKAAQKPSPANVHKFRTTCRRAETVLERLVPTPDRNTKRLIKLLARLRRKAGKVRDLDVQAEALRGLKLSRSAQKAQLLKSLCAERAKQERKFSQRLDSGGRELKDRLKRATRKSAMPAGMEPLSAALQDFGKLERDHAPLSASKLHQYRVTGKQARYLVEMGKADPEADRVIEQLRRMQDAIGDWHDWLALSERAETLFGSVKDSALVAAMRNLTRAKFRQALDAVSETRSALAGETVGLVREPGQPARKPSAPAALRSLAAA